MSAPLLQRIGGLRLSSMLLIGVVAVCAASFSQTSQAADPSPKARLTILDPQPNQILTGTTVRVNFTFTVIGAEMPQVHHVDVQLDRRSVEHDPAVFNSSYRFFSVPPGTHVIKASLIGPAGERLSEEISVPFTTVVSAAAVQLTAAPQILRVGESAILSWSSTQAVSCDALVSPWGTAPAWLGSKPLSGTQVVTPRVSSYYYLRCVDSVGRMAESYVPVKVTQGLQQAIVILANFQDATLPSYFSDRVAMGQLIFQGPFGAYYRQASRGKLWFGGTVVGPYTLPMPACSNSFNSVSLAVQAADPDVFFPNYQHVIVIHPSCGGTSYSSGSIQMETNDGPVVATRSSISAMDFGSDTGSSFLTMHLIHEVGHGFDLPHADRLDCGSTMGGTLCHEYEYGDVYDLMGQGGIHSSLFNAALQDRLGWLGTEHLRALVQSDDSGSYVLASLEQPTAGLQALKIRRADGRWYYLEYRQPSEFDADVPSADTQGVLVHVSVDRDLDYAENTQLLDMTPEDGQASYALPVGRTFTDGSGITITTEGLVSGGLRVRVDLSNSPTPPPPPVTPPATPPSAPTVTFTATSATITAGERSTLTWTATNVASCVADGSWYGTKSLKGSVIVLPRATSIYTLACTGTGGTVSGTVIVTVTPRPVPVVNLAPRVAAGPDQTLTLPQTVASLSATVSDDGLPNPPGQLTLTWSRYPGSGSVSFGDVHAAQTTATFSAPGMYVLRLTASDGQYQRSDALVVRVMAPPAPRNMPPSLTLGPSLALSTQILPASGPVSATVTDDGLPNPPGAAAVIWSKASGPGMVIFQDAHAASTSAVFSAAGTYVLRLIATDGQYQRTGYLRVTVRVERIPTI